MASHQLGPETPRPFSVLSEGHVHAHTDLPDLREPQGYSFGDQYERTLCKLIDRYLELDTCDRLCYVGDPRGSLATKLQSRFCLLEPVTTVVPGHIHYEESPNHRMLPIKVANVGAEEFFRRAVSGGPQPLFDKILFKDAVRFFDKPRQTFKEALQLLSERGRMVIIQRPASMNSLPVFSEARSSLEAHDQSYLQIIRDLQACQLDVQWDVECLPVTMLKSQWYAMLRDRFPAQMEIVSPFQVTSGLRELSEGIMKYGDDVVEFKDRLLFISASRTLFSDVPQIARYGTPAHASNPLPPASEMAMRYEMEVTPDLERLVQEKGRRERLNSASRGYNRLNRK